MKGSAGGHGGYGYRGSVETSGGGTGRSRVWEVEVPAVPPEEVLRGNGPISGKVTVLVEELLRKDQEMRAMHKEIEKVRLKTMRAVSGLVYKWFDTGGQWLRKECFKKWAAMVGFLALERLTGGLEGKAFSEFKRREKEIDQLTEVLETRTVRNAMVQDDLNQVLTMKDKVGKENANLSQQVTQLQRQLADAERCVLKLQGDAAAAAEQARQEASQYEERMRIVSAQYESDVEELLTTAASSAAGGLAGPSPNSSSMQQLLPATYGNDLGELKEMLSHLNQRVDQLGDSVKIGQELGEVSAMTTGESPGRGG